MVRVRFEQLDAELVANAARFAIRKMSDDDVLDADLPAGLGVRACIGADALEHEILHQVNSPRFLPMLPAQAFPQGPMHPCALPGVPPLGPAPMV